jgi:hypothetical protein
VFELGENTTVVTGSALRIMVGPLDGWRLTQVFGPYYDNHLRGPENSDKQNLNIACVDEAS